MASSSDVVKRVMRLKLQLTDTTEAATVLNILQKLKDLDITLDILAETGIGKTVNALRRHEQAGEFARSLIKGWKRLVPKASMSHPEDGNTSLSLSVKHKLEDQKCPNYAHLALEDVNNNHISHDKHLNSSSETLFETGSRKVDSGKRNKDHSENEEKNQQENQSTCQKAVLKKKAEIQDDQIDISGVSTVEKCETEGDAETLPGNKNSEATHLNSKSDSREISEHSSDNGRFVFDKESSKESKTLKEFTKGERDSFTIDCSTKHSKTSESSSTSEARSSKRKKLHKEKSENERHSKHNNKKANGKNKNKERNSDLEGPSMSFESYLNYDVAVSKRRERSGVKKPFKKMKSAIKEATAKDADTKANKSPVISSNATSEKQHFKESVMDLLNIPLPVVLPECEKPSSVMYFERKAEKEPDVCNVSEECAGFTGQRLNRKMQVYSGTKTICLPTMMSLHQQCIRTLQNNINLLYETGGVPFEILEPVLERCTPEQLLRIEEYNPIYIGVTDHLWGKHCQRDFRDAKLQEYESWKEMYIRLSDERERKFQRLTKSIVSAHSNKPKGRQVKMAFIHTVAKPPRDVRIQQEIHGTAVQQPHQLSVKVPDSRSRQSCNEPSRSSSSTSGTGNTQDPRKKTRIAPMMAKSLKAFKKQLGRR
ncbi:uncharacterized protein V6R79_018231 [Siganus canaliculatus]